VEFGFHFEKYSFFVSFYNFGNLEIKALISDSKCSLILVMFNLNLMNFTKFKIIPYSLGEL